VVSFPAFAASDVDSAPEIPNTKQSIEVVGFTKDGKEIILKIVDEHVGDLLQVRQTKKNKILKAYPFQSGEDKRAWRRVKKTYPPAQDYEPSAEHPRRPYTLMTVQKGDNIGLFVMKGDRIKPYAEIPLLKSKEGVTAEAFVKQAVWGPRGKHIVVVYHQKTADKLTWEGDFVRTFKFKSYRVNFDDSEEGEK